MVVDTAQRFASTWLYICVVEREQWPSSSWIVRRSAPPSSRCVANACRRRCGCGTRRRSVDVSRRRPRAERKSAFSAPRASCGPRVAQVARDEVRRLLAERDDAVLAALALAHVHALLLEVDVAEVEADRLGGAQPGRVDELDERAVAEPERAVDASNASTSSSTSPSFGASGRRRGRFGARLASGTRSGPSA